MGWIYKIIGEDCMNISDFPGLQIASSLVNEDAPNFRPNSWPIKYDFPVVVDSKENIVSRYSDVRWDFSPWEGSNLKIYFGDGPGQGHKVSSENANLLRQVMAWWLWGHGAAAKPKTLVFKFKTIKPIFVICSKHNILASELSDHPNIIKKIAISLKVNNDHIITYLNDLKFISEKLGFTILDDEGMKIFISNLLKTTVTQTAYIPVRIWSYQVGRLKECLDDFMEHREKIEKLHQFCLDAYAKNAGGDLSLAFEGLGANQPFGKFKPKGQSDSNKVFHGKFSEIAEKFEIDELLEKWVRVDHSYGIRTLSSYMSLISVVGLAYILNFSLMRLSEGSKLRTNCLEIEKNHGIEDIYLIRGVTTKTVEDDNALWIVSPTVKIAIDAMTIVANLRVNAAKNNSKNNMSENDINNPLLQTMVFEPWQTSKDCYIRNGYKTMRAYTNVSNVWPKLFDDNEMRITDKDLEMANRLTFNLDPEKYSVGKIWPLSWHQLRRTGAVNMLASGLVSELSLQYQLKHSSLAMTQYYGQNYYKLKGQLSDEARGFYLREMYESIVRDFKSLQDDHYISPHNEKRKEQILTEISEKDHKELIKAAKNGKISYRETFLGGCANLGPPCPLGGISNISSCMGFGDEKPCKSILIDKDKLPIINQLKEVLNNQVMNVDVDTPLYHSIQTQLESAERAIYVINRS